MTTVPASHSAISPPSFTSVKGGDGETRPRRVRNTALMMGAGLFLAASLVFAQGAPKVTGVEPGTGKVNESITVSGANLTKDSVVAVFLSDDKSDYKAAIVNQAADKIVMKVPQVKPGPYNVSIQVGSGILIEPVRFTVQE
jgi:hypothetical protein